MVRKKTLVFLLITLAAGFLQDKHCHASTYAYVASSNDSLYIIRTSDHSLLWDDDNNNIVTVNGIGIGPHGVAVAPLGNYVFVADPSSHSVPIIRTSDRSSWDEIDAENASPQAVAVSEDGKFLYITVVNGLYVVDINDRDLKPHWVARGEQLSGVAAFSKFGSYYAYVADRGSNEVLIIKDRNGDDYSVPVGIKPTGVAVAPDQKYVYVTNAADGTASVIPVVDYPSENVDVSEIITLDASDDIGEKPTGIAVMQKGANQYRVYIANQGGTTEASISVIDIDVEFGHEVLKSYQINGTETHPLSQPYGISVTPDGKHAYVTNKGNGTLSIIATDGPTPKIIKTIYLGGSPTSLGNFIGMMPPPPKSPTDFTATVTSDQTIKLQWTDDSSDELGFRIERKSNADKEYSGLHDTLSDIELYIDTNVTEAVTYYYQIKAFNVAGDSEYVTAEEVTVPLKAPTTLRVTGTSHDSVSLQWEDKSNAESGYAIERRIVAESTNDGSDETDSSDEEQEDNDNTEEDTGNGLASNSTSFSKIATVDVNVETFSDSGLNSGTTYAYRVRAFHNPHGEPSEYSNEVEADTDEDYACFIGTAAYGSSVGAASFEVILIGVLFFCLGMFFLRLCRQKASVYISSESQSYHSRLNKKHFNSPYPKVHLS